MPIYDNDIEINAAAVWAGDYHGRNLIAVLVLDFNWSGVHE